MNIKQLKSEIQVIKNRYNEEMIERGNKDTLKTLEGEINEVMNIFYKSLSWYEREVLNIHETPKVTVTNREATVYINPTNKSTETVIKLMSNLIGSEI